MEEPEIAATKGGKWVALGGVGCSSRHWWWWRWRQWHLSGVRAFVIGSSFVRLVRLQNCLWAG